MQKTVAMLIHIFLAQIGMYYISHRYILLAVFPSFSLSSDKTQIYRVTAEHVNIIKFNRTEL